MPSYYHNEMLFSEIYLEEITQQIEDSDTLASLRALGEFRDYANSSTLETWQKTYVNEVLSALGFLTRPSSTIATGSTSDPSHVTNLFQMGISEAEKPLSLCYAVLPEVDLNNTTMGRNWAEKIIRALRQNNLQWGLLTNGKQWRIYHLDEPTPYETYLEMDLEAILADKAKEAYQIFYKFLKAENFLLDQNSKCQFDRFKKESQDKIDYIEKELANALKQREEGGKGVLSDLCMGYVSELRRQNQADLDDEDRRKKIYHSAMLYMFRLLFLFYADARSLLSDENHERLTKVVGAARASHGQDPSGVNEFSTWNELEHIFVDIDQTYNGGLFSPQESEFTRFLSEVSINQNYLDNVIHNLTTYHEKNGQERLISYRDMSVRHLGTLYEGLLEHKLYIANEDTEVKTSKGKIQFIPVSEGGKLVVGHYIKPGEIYFSGDRSERKSTGSFYTPEFIVDYIVRNTVGEKLKELRDSFLVEQRLTIDAFQKALDPDEQSSLRNLVKEKLVAFIREKVLELTVLDPAMGSGHFLVNTTNLISNFITDILNEDMIIGEEESKTSFWRRWVVENCIYGVDLNPLAVELAKLSLWILSMEKNQPLSFLNHHLKCGNSLVGARIEEIGNYTAGITSMQFRQLNLFEQDPDLKAAIEEAIFKSRQISRKASMCVDDVHEKKAWLGDIDHVLEGYKAIFDVHISRKFGKKVDENQYSSILQTKNFSLARSLAQEKYFHWELEFPILLYNNGFDAVIGNPPYVNIRYQEEKIKQYIRECYHFSGGADIYVAFIENSLRLMKNTGSFSFIVPNKFFGADYGKAIRDYLQNGDAKISQILDLKDEKLFETALISTIVLVIRKEKTHIPTLLIQNKNFRRISNIFDRAGKIQIEQDVEGKEIVEKVSTNIFMDQIADIRTGIMGFEYWKMEEIISDKDPNGEIVKLYTNGNFGRYRSTWGSTQVNLYKKKYLKPSIRLDRKILSQNTIDLFKMKNKIIVRGVSGRLAGIIDFDGAGLLVAVHSITPTDVSWQYLLGLVNSNLLNWYHLQTQYSIRIPQGSLKYPISFFKQLPIPIPTKNNINTIIKIENCVNQIIEDYGKHTINSHLDVKINQLVYSLYGLTDREINVIESDE